MNTQIRPIRVLLVDDFPAWRELISTILCSRADITIVGEAVDGFEAVNKAQELKPDLILLDIGLPGISGIDAARRIAKLLPESRIIFVSQCLDKTVVEEAMNDGARGFIVKMDARSELLKGIAIVLEGERFVSSRVSKQ